MRIVGNILWFLLGGMFVGLAWVVVGILWCVTIIGFPVGLQCFKMAGLTFFPFGKEIIFRTNTGYVLLNVLWLIFGGLELAVVFLVIGIFFCCTIVGIPLGVQAFKLLKLSLLPFGAEVTKLT